MRRAKRAPIRFGRPGTAVCSWMTIGDAAGLDALPRADPGAGDGLLAQDGGDGEAGTRVTAGTAPRDDDVDRRGSFARRGRAAGARGSGTQPVGPLSLWRSSASSIRRSSSSDRKSVV